MNLRKINAIISMLIVVLLLDHAIFYAVVMLSRYRIPTHATVLPWMITALVFFSLDTLAMLSMGIGADSIIDIVFHVWVIVSLSMGISACSKLKKLPPEEIEVTEYAEANEEEKPLAVAVDSDEKAYQALKAIYEQHGSISHF